MKFQILIFALSLSLVYMLDPNYAITSATAENDACGNDGYTFVLVGTTDTSIAETATVSVTLTSPTGATASCTVGAVTVTRLRRNDEVTITCKTTSTITNEALTVSNVKINNVAATLSDTISISGVTCPATVTISTLAIKPTSVSQKKVVLELKPADSDKNKALTGDSEITGLKLVDSGTFNQNLKCEIQSGSKLSSVTCSMETAAVDGTNYKLSGTPAFVGRDTITTLTPDTSTEVTASTSQNNNDNNNNNNNDNSNGFYLKSSFIFLILLFF